VTKAPFNRPYWDIVILHPRALLPEGMPISIAQNRFFYSRDPDSEVPPLASQIIWSSWVVSTDGDRLCSSSQPKEYFKPFIAEDARDMLKFFPVSSLAMVVNAHCKLRQFTRDHHAAVTPRIQIFADLMSELVDAIFFVPKGMPNVARSKNAANVPHLPVPQLLSGGTFGSLSSREIQPARQPSGHEIDIEMPTAPDSMQVATTLQDAISAIDFPESPDPADGLTDSEFRLVFEKASDSHLNASERADAAMMMLFGTHRECAHFPLRNC